MSQINESRIEAVPGNRLWLRCLFLLAALCIWSGSFAADQVTFIHTDLYGSPVAATNDSAEVVWRAQHTPYGEEVLRSDFPRDSVGYTGHLFDNQTDLSYFQARTYDPAVGRFLGVDPVGVDAGNLHSFNRYTYANNNPYRYVDPDGRTPAVLWWAVGALLTIWDMASNDPVPGAEQDAIAPVNIFPGPVKLGGQALKEGGELVAKRTKPAISAQKQAGHIPGTPQNANRLKQGKPTSSFFGEKSGERLTQQAFEKGKTVSGRQNVREHDFGVSTGTGPNGGMQTRIRVHQDSKGRIHGHPSGPERY